MKENDKSMKQGARIIAELVDLMWYLAVTTTYHYIIMRARPENIKLY